MKPFAASLVFVAGVILSMLLPGAPGYSFGQEEGAPPLPLGLDKPAEPALPAGLAEGDEAEAGQPAQPGGLDQGPVLPAGLAGEKEPAMPGGLQDAGQDTVSPRNAPGGFEAAGGLPAGAGFAGFWELRGGLRLQPDPHEKSASIGEARLQLEVEPSLGAATFKITADFIYDPVLDRPSIQLEAGQGWFDLREANLSLSPLTFMDLKLGRQILTWGTGDFMFINDLFPKDWQAFFIGRDENYLKAPSDAVKISLYAPVANLDVVFSPRFDPDRFIRGTRISYFNPGLGELAGRDAVIDADLPETWMEDAEWAARVSRNIQAYELAVYGYWGYWKSPGGVEPATGKAIFPRLSVYGASVRGPLGRGIGNLEFGVYDSREDRSGYDPWKNNSEFRFLAGYETDWPRIARDLTLGFQYYVEWLADYDAYRRSLPAALPARDEVRHVVTARLVKLLMNQNLALSLFAFYSPSDADAYIRPRANYKIDDHWTAEVGGNLFAGSSKKTFFGQFRRNTNAYLAIRYGF